MALTASSPLRASSTLNPPAVNDFRSALRRANSSSTTNTLVDGNGMIDFFRVTWQRETEGHASLRIRFKAETASMSRRDFSCHIQSQARSRRKNAGIGATVEPVENTRLVARGNEASV